MYVQQAGISETRRVKELLSLLGDEPFRVVLQHGLLEIDDFHAVTVSATAIRTRWKRTRMAVQATNQNTEAWRKVG